MDETAGSARPETKAGDENKTEVRTEAKVEAKAEARVEAKAEAKEEAQAEVKGEAQAEADGEAVAEYQGPPLVQLDEEAITTVGGQLGNEKADAMRSMHKLYFLAGELVDRLMKLNFTQDEIGIVFAYVRELSEEDFRKRYRMTPDTYRKWLESLFLYKDKPEENPFYLVHPPLQVIEEEKFEDFY